MRNQGKFRPVLFFVGMVLLSAACSPSGSEASPAVSPEASLSQVEREEAALRVYWGDDYDRFRKKHEDSAQGNIRQFYKACSMVLEGVRKDVTDAEYTRFSPRRLTWRTCHSDTQN